MHIAFLDYYKITLYFLVKQIIFFDIYLSISLKLLKNEVIKVFFYLMEPLL